MSPSADVTPGSASGPDARTGLVTLSEDECWRRLEAHSFGRLAVNVGSQPDIFPVNYLVRRGEIVVRTEAGTKLAAAVMLGAVAFEIDEVDFDAETGWSVVVAGRAREPQRLDEILELDESGAHPWVDAPKTRWLVITPRSVTGRQVPLAPPGPPPA